VRGIRPVVAFVIRSWDSGRANRSDWSGTTFALGRDLYFRSAPVRISLPSSKHTKDQAIMSRFTAKVSFSIVWAILATALPCIWATRIAATEPPSDTATAMPEVAHQSPGAETAAGTGNSDSQASNDRMSKSQRKKLLADATKIDGLIPLFRTENKLYGEILPKHYKSEFIVLISIARGIGRAPLYGGMTWGDDWVWKFRKADDRLLIVRRNVRFRADEDTPAATAIKYAYTDSVLFSLPIITKGPKGGDLVDLSSVFMSDLPQITQVLPTFFFSRDKSTWADVKGFEDNVEIEVAATYASNGRSKFDSVPDSRGITVNVHYSISKIKRSGKYKPREADDRIGYFLTVVKDYSKTDRRDRFVRYVNRWHLQKADPKAKVSPPKEPIVFWLENTIPFKYRKTIRDGILAWNAAFETAGFADAIEVRQQPDDATWDAEDINYNTFRWITSSAGFAMGPSRVNPYTGQILDADIIFDADFLQYWKRDFETFTKEDVAAMTGGPLEVEDYLAQTGNRAAGYDALISQCFRTHSMARQFAFGSAALDMMRHNGVDVEAQEEMVRQGLQGTVMHEVGHTLGLRHNFKGSTWLDLDELNHRAPGAPLLSSVMDYDSVNIVPPGKPQGAYFTTDIGPYDVWAIEYGYKPFDGKEQEELAKIAARSGEPVLAYATDEDTRGIDVDPLSNRWDLGKDPMEFARRQAELVQALLPDVVEHMTREGEDYSQARRAFNVLLSTHGQALFLVSRYVGGLHTSRSHYGDANAKRPLEVVSVERQREALQLLSQQVFSDEPFKVPHSTYNHLMSSRWVHWGSHPSTRPDYPIHDVILMWQTRVLDRLLSGLTLTRVLDAELAVDPDEDCLTTAELLSTLTDDVFAEVVGGVAEGEYTNRSPAISSLRRNLQRVFMKRLARLALGHTSAPEDCQTVAYLELKRLHQEIQEALDGAGELDTYTQAHLEETASRVRAILDAKFTQNAP
jgi:hypothetical protein